MKDKVEGRALLLLALALLALVAAMGAKGFLITLPEPPAAAGQGFDANRAHDRLSRILAGEFAHPVDLPANDLVRARLIREMRAVGLSPRLSDDFACNGSGRYVGCARVRNLVATIGPANSREPLLLLSAHYDSTFAGPGAADAGIGVATLLEVADRLRGRALKRPISFLFNEGEEAGLIGARAFLERDPLARRVGALINLEARGVTGPADMFETSRPNGRAIAWYGRSVDRPAANSLSTDLYKMMPNSTDVTVLEEAGWTILNLAITGNETRYHSQGDDLAALDRNSLQHMGSQALALTLDFEANGLPAAGSEKVFIDLLGIQLVTLPVLLALIIVGFLFVLFLVLAWKRKALGRPLAAVLLALVASTGFAWLGAFLIGLLRQGEYWRGHPWVTELAVHASALAAALLAISLVARHAGSQKLRVAVWLVFLLCGAVISYLAPGGAILFLIPPAIALAGIAASRFHAKAEQVGALLAALVLFLTLAPAVDRAEELMNRGPLWLFAPLGALLLLPWVAELAPLLARVRTVFLLVGAGDLFLLPWLAVLLTPAYSDDRRQLFTLDHVGGPNGQAWWTINNDSAAPPLPGAWTRGPLPYSPQQRWRQPAPALGGNAPPLERIGESRVPQGRLVRLRLRTEGAESLAILAPAGSGWVAAGAPGFLRTLSGDTQTPAQLRCVGRSCDGAEFHIVTTNDRPVQISILGSRPGLPPQGAALARARPALAQPQYSPDSTIRFARTGF